MFQKVTVHGGAPIRFFDSLESGGSLPYFWKMGGYAAIDGAAWQTRMHPASGFGGQVLRLYLS